MRSALRTFAILAIALLAAGPGVAQTPRAPTAGWVLEFAPSQCLASRAYGSAAAPLTLAIKPSPLGDVVQLALILPSAKGRSAAREEKAIVRIDGAAAIEATALAMNARGTSSRTLRINLPSDRLQGLREATRLSISVKDELDETFALRLMKPLLETMDQCLADLRHEWNVDKADQLSVRARPKANLASYVSDSDYPDETVDREQSGTVGFVLLIDENGKLADCMVTATSQVAFLDVQACAVFMTRARFEPARSADGKPAKDALVSRLRWVLP
jgi:hypothetical protein